MREGCVGETLSALTALRRREHLTPAGLGSTQLGRALGTICAAETKHARLAWDTVQWLLASGGSDVRAAVKAAFAEAIGAAESAQTAGGGGGGSRGQLWSHGYLTAAQTADFHAERARVFIAPLATELLDGEAVVLSF